MIDGHTTLDACRATRRARFDVFLPESDSPFAKTLHTDSRLYDGRVPHGKRVAQVVEWLSLPEGMRSDLMMLYFSAVDPAGHTFGPESK